MSLGYISPAFSPIRLLPFFFFLIFQVFLIKLIIDFKNGGVCSHVRTGVLVEFTTFSAQWPWYGWDSIGGPHVML